MLPSCHTLVPKALRRVPLSHSERHAETLKRKTYKYTQAVAKQLENVQHFLFSGFRPLR